jgi:hypothetical protein
MAKPELPVVFRKWYGTYDTDAFGNRRYVPGVVEAYFPTMPGTNDPRTCTGYAFVGQHFSADWSHCVRCTRQASVEEYTPLLKHLRSVYNDCELVPYFRAKPWMHAERKKALGI